MTRAEYEAKYGETPTATSSVKPKKEGDFTTGLAKGAILRPLKGLAKMGEGIVNLLPGKDQHVYSEENLAKSKFGKILTEENLKAKKGEGLGTFVGEAATFAIPGGAVTKATKGMSLIPRIATRAATSGGVAALQSPEGEKGGNAAIAAGVETALPILGGIVGKPLGKAAGKIAQNLEKMNLRLTPKQKMLLEREGNETIDFLTRNKITGSPEQRLQKMDKIYNSFEKKVQSELTKSGKTYPKEELVKKIQAIPEKYATEFDSPEVFDNLTKLSKSLAKYVQTNFKGEVPIEKLNAFKRSFAKSARNKMGDQVLNEARDALSDTLYAEILQDVPALQAINNQYKHVIRGRKLLEAAVGRKQLGWLGNLISVGSGASLGGAIGGPVGGTVGAVVGPAVARTVAGTSARSRAGAALQTLSELAAKSKGDVVVPRAIIEALMTED